MTNTAQPLFRIDPTEGLVDYVQTVKPYHTKILEVLIEYIFAEDVNVTVTDRWNWNMEFRRPYSDVAYSCGYGYRWDQFGITAPETPATSLITKAQGKSMIDISIIGGSSVINIIRNVSERVMAVGDPVVFDADSDISIKCFDLTPENMIDECMGRVGIIEAGRTYYVVASTPTTLEVAETDGGTPIVFTTTDTLRILPQEKEGLQYNSFLVGPTLHKSQHHALVTSTVANQLAFVDGYEITSVDTSDNRWRVRVGTWTAGTGYTQGLQTNITLLGGHGTGAIATVRVDTLGHVTEVMITSPGTGYLAGDVLIPLNLLGAPGSGFQFTVTGKWTAGMGYTPGTHTNVPLVGGMGIGAHAAIVVNSLGSVSSVAITNVGSGYNEGDVLYISLGQGSGFNFTWSNNNLTLPLVEGDSIFINGNTTGSLASIANGKYTVDNVVGSIIWVKEDIPPMTSWTGTLYTLDEFSTIPYWPSGAKVKVTSASTLPEPLYTAGEYYFIPTKTIGIFNLATKRYPLKYEDFVDITTFGSLLSIERVEPFSPGDYVSVTGSTMQHNDGKYMISTVEPEGDNYRVGVLQSVRRTTPSTFAEPNDGAMTVIPGSYDMPIYCPVVQSPDLYAGAFIHENLQFVFSITEKDFVGAIIEENTPEGWGVDPFGDVTSPYSTGSDRLLFNTTLTDGVYSGGNAASAHILLPTGFDTQLFDVGAVDESWQYLLNLQAIYPAAP